MTISYEKTCDICINSIHQYIYSVREKCQYSVCNVLLCKCTVLSIVCKNGELFKKIYKRGTTVPYCGEPEYLLNEISYLLLKICYSLIIVGESLYKAVPGVQSHCMYSDLGQAGAMGHLIHTVLYFCVDAPYKN